MQLAKVSFPSLRARASRLVVTFVVASSLAGGPPARAQEPGVVYEPGSPSDKEYAIPLDEARRDAGGDIRGSLESRAFGIGLSRHGDRGGRRRNRRGDEAGAARGQGRADQVNPTESRDFRDRLADAEAAGAPPFWRLAPLLLVLLPGLLVGLLLARQGPRQPVT